MRAEPRHDLDRYRSHHPTLGMSPAGAAYGYFVIGRLNVIAAPAPTSSADAWWPWEHVSVSRRDSRETPTWEEMDRIKRLWWRDDETVVQFHPAEAHKVNFHTGCLHLWRCVDAPLALPDRRLV